MYRLLISLPLCLLLCLLLAPDQPEDEEAPPPKPLAPAAADQEPLPVKDPLAFLEKCLERYDEQGIKGYSCIMQKQERIDGKLQPSEETECFFREKPYSVFMHWLRGQRKADSALYVEGENDGKLLAHPSGVAGKLVKVVSRDPEGDEARQVGRYTLKEFGRKKALQRTLDAWKAEKAQGTLHAEYLGVRKVREAGDRLCYTLRRTSATPDKDGITEATVYIDKENWLQVRTVLKGEKEQLIGDYVFRDIHLNPKFKSDQFKSSALAP